MRTQQKEYIDIDQVIKPIGEDEYYKPLHDLEREAAEEARQSDSEGKRTRDRAKCKKVQFFVQVAKDTGSITLAALVFHVVVWTKSKRKNDKDPATWDPTYKFAEALGISVVQTRRLIKQACDLGYLRCVQGKNKIYLYVRKCNLYNYKKQDTLYYNKEDAAESTITESILINKFNNFWKSDRSNSNAFRISFKKLQEQFHCFSIDALRRALYRLKARGFLDWNKFDCYADSYAYFSPLTTAKDKVSPMARDVMKTEDQPVDDPCLKYKKPVYNPRLPKGPDEEAAEELAAEEAAEEAQKAPQNSLKKEAKTAWAKRSSLGQDDIPSGQDDIPSGQDDLPTGQDDLPLILSKHYSGSITQEALRKHHPTDAPSADRSR